MNDLDLRLLPSIPLQQREDFPEQPAVYFAIASDGSVQYIGRSINPRQRWVNHHRHRQLKTMDGVCIAFMFVDESELSNVEAAMISRFSPTLNTVKNGPNPKYRKKTPRIAWRRFNVSIPFWFHRRLKIAAKFKGTNRARLAAGIIQEEIDKAWPDVQKELEAIAKYRGITVEELEAEWLKDEAED